MTLLCICYGAQLSESIIRKIRCYGDRTHAVILSNKPLIFCCSRALFLPHINAIRFCRFNRFDQTLRSVSSKSVLVVKTAAGITGVAVVVEMYEHRLKQDSVAHFGLLCVHACNASDSVQVHTTVCNQTLSMKTLYCSIFSQLILHLTAGAPPLVQRLAGL